MKRFSELLFLFLVLAATCLMLCFPQAAYQGACRGLETWCVHLLPSLLPFFIAADLLLSLGFVRFLGVLLEPVMRPLFRLPGEAGFALALGFTSGFPMGAILTASLKEQNLCTRQEAARLAAFTSNSSPLFLLISVPVSMLQQPQLGPLLLASHYLANLTIGILLRFLAPASRPPKTSSHLFSKALKEMQYYYRQNHRPFGTMLGQAIQKGISSIVNVGGFVLLFSVLLELLQATGILSLIQSFFSVILHIFSFSANLAPAISAGFFEMTLGAQTAAQCQAPLLEQLMTISFILGWSGLSIQAQVNSILASQQISSRLYCLCRPLQGFLSALYIPVLLMLFPHIASIHTSQSVFSTSSADVISIFRLATFPVAALLLLLALSGSLHLFHRLKKRI